MLTVKGKSVSDEIAIGKLYFIKQNSRKIKRVHIDDIQLELERFNNARITAQNQLEELYQQALKEIDEANAMIFRIHKVMLNDIDYRGAIENIIKTQAVNAEFAVGITSDKFIQTFAQMDDEYIKARAADINDISERMLKILLGEHPHTIHSKIPVIIVADDLSPSQTIQLDKSKILGFVTFKGSSNSHAAILARTLNIPAIIGTGTIPDEYNGADAVINGIDNCVYIHPDFNTIEAAKKLHRQNIEDRKLLMSLRGKPNVTKDGRHISIYANINCLSDINTIVEKESDGIGLLRSEFLYLESKTYPTEDELFNSYKDILIKMGSKHVSIRTLDIGSDKKSDYFGLAPEKNPALGYRAIRICLKQTDIFKTQLRALFRASAYGNLSIIIPMITSVDEIQRVKAIINDVKAELSCEGISYKDNVPIGIMIETPAAALISRSLAKEVDFFSIGTNDLTQYTLAIDRQNGQLDEFYNPHHPAVIELIRMTVENAHNQGIPCGICGELGADTEMTQLFIEMDVDYVSMTSHSILKVRDKVRSLDLSYMHK